MPAQPCVKSSFMAGWQQCHLELQMLEQPSRALDVLGIAEAGCGGGLSSAPRCRGSRGRAGTAALSSLETSQLCPGLQTWLQKLLARSSCCWQRDWSVQAATALSVLSEQRGFVSLEGRAALGSGDFLPFGLSGAGL